MASPGGTRRVLLPRIARWAVAAAALCACLLPAPCWSGEELAEVGSRLAPRGATAREFDLALEKLTPLSPEEVRELRLLFDGDNPAAQRPALDALLQKVGTLSRIKNMKEEVKAQLDKTGFSSKVDWQKVEKVLKERSGIAEDVTL